METLRQSFLLISQGKKMADEDKAKRYIIIVSFIQLNLILPESIQILVLLVI